MDRKTMSTWVRLATLLALGAAPALVLGAPSSQGIQPQGIQPQGIQPQGIQPQGIQPQGIQAAGVALLGTDLLAAELRGVDIGSVDLRGTTADSALAPFELTSGPGISTGSGDYIAVGGASAAGHYATAHLVDPQGGAAEDLDLYIADERGDPAPNLLHRGDLQANEDVTLYTVFAFHRWSGQWASLCPFDPATAGATAMAIAEDPAQPSRFIFACTASGVAAKCARNWGFRPWRTDHTFVFDDAPSVNDWVDRTFALKPFYDACKIAARAAYCQDRQSFTRNGTLIDLFDTRQFVWPNAIENPFGDSPDSRWMFTQEFFVSVDPLQSHPQLKASALQRTRYRELSPVGQCADLAFVDRLEQDHFEDGRWASPLTNTPRIQVMSPSYCAHNEHEVGAALAWDCSPCTTSVCKTTPGCCRLDRPGQAWDALCVAEAAISCDDPPGRVWPRDLPPAPPAPRKFLLGPGGAVERVDGTGASATTLTGWACDPEWPGAAVTVAVYGGGPREQPGATLLGLAYADQGLAAPLAGEVGSACDGPNRTSARHGFSFEMPPGFVGNAFVYALDTATPDGPAAPPTLLRNGIVNRGATVGGGRPVAAVTTGWIEAPSSGSYQFSSPVEPSRLFVNGQKIVDWWDGPGPTEGNISLLAGGRYHLRWDRAGSTPPGQGPVAGLTWRTPENAGQAPIPAALLYRLVPGAGQGLAATYFDDPHFAGPSVERQDPAVDLGTGPPASARLPDGIAPSTFSVVWQGELVPIYSEDYTFIVTSAGSASLSIAGQALLPPEVTEPPLAPACAHDICALGDKLAASSPHQETCHPCVDQICAQDPFCCNGGYLSYYSSEPVWDAKCVAEVGALCGLACKNPLPQTTTRQRAGTPIALRAGVRYPIQLAVDDDTADVTTQLQWASARQAREIVPTRALFATGAAAGAGAGLNVVLFATQSSDDGGVKPDLDTPLSSGSVPDLSIGGPTGGAGLPLVEVLATASDPVAGVPAPPAVVSPRFGSHDVQPSPQVALTVIGGVRGGSLRARVQGTSIDVILPFDADGTVTRGVVPVGSYGPRTLVLEQRTYAGATCASSPAALCAQSTPISWDVVVDEQAPASPPPPVIEGPRDPTNSPDPTSNVFRVSGHGIPAAVRACDQGGIGAAGVLSDSLRAAADGTISGTVTLTSGTPINPNAGWHKLSLSQDQCATTSKPVFISVGIRPPTVEFPRSGAPIDCSLGGVVGQLVARGTVPYAEATFGPLVVAEELGRLALGLIGALVSVDATPGPDGSFAFQAVLPALPIGKHLLYFFQAPPPLAGATQAERDAHFRAFASIASTPRSRIAIAVPPLPLALPVGAPTVITGLAPILSAVNCALAPGAACALPRADINIRDGQRVWTARASDAGDWELGLPGLAPGWHQLTVGQVIDSPAGGGWVESCASPALPVGVATAGASAPALALPGGLSLDATSLAGALLGYDARATAAAGTPIPVECQPPSGAVFPIGVTNVLCTAVDPATQAVGLGTFPVTVIDGPPTLCDLGDASVEASGPLGATVSFATCAFDRVDGPVAVTCDHPSGSRFSLGATVVTCTATDRSGNRAQGSFTERVAVSWSNLLAPIDLLGLAVFLRGLPVPVQFTLTGPSAGISNLTARLFLAPVDSAGHVGTERPAVARAPGVANLFLFVPLLNQYLLTLNTGGLGAGIWQLRVDLGDGLPHTARIRLL